MKAPFYLYDFQRENAGERSQFALLFVSGNIYSSLSSSSNWHNDTATKVLIAGGAGKRQKPVKIFYTRDTPTEAQMLLRAFLI